MAATVSHTRNKLKRQEQYIRFKKTRESSRRGERFRRKREEAKDPHLRDERRRRNVPVTLERKRKWDDEGDIGEHDHGLGKAVDLQRVKRLQTNHATPEAAPEVSSDGADEDSDHNVEAKGNGSTDDERDSMLDPESEAEDEDQEDKPASTSSDNGAAAQTREVDATDSTEPAKLDLAPAALVEKFPALFSTEPCTPKTLVTTFLHSTLHREAFLLTTLFPNSVYVRRSAHRYSHNFSVREIAQFASNRDYTLLVVLKEDQKKPTGLTIAHLPRGPTFHFSISNWVEGKKIPGHGNPTGHYPELILNNFRTPLGILTAHLFRSIFPSQPELQGRTVVTLHNQRDYIFVRRHRYVFRDKRPTEKSVVGRDGKEIKGVEEIRAGLQELGPRFTLKLRRIDTGIGRAGSNGQVEWEWKGRMDKQRTKFQL